MKKFFLFINIALILTIFSFFEAFSNDADIVTLREQVNFLQKEYEKLNNKIEILEHKLQTNVSSANSSPEINNSDQQSSEVNTTSNQENITKQNIDDLKEEDNAISESSEKDSYELALACLKSGNNSEAQEKFKNFVEKFPKSKYIGNAFFWYGESYLRLSDYKSASIYFLKCYKHDKSGPKASDSLLKLVSALSESGKKLEACSILRKIEKEFPKRSISAIKKGQELKTKLKCN